MLLYVKNLHLRIGACLPCSGTQASRRKLLLSPCRADVGSAKTRRVHRPAEAGFSFVEPRPKRATDIKKGACAAAEFCGAQAPFLRFWPCRVEEGAFPRRVGFTASAAGCVGHRSPSVSHLRYSRLDASLRSRPLAAANGRLPACVRAARRPVCSGFSRMARERPASVSEPALVPRRCGRLCRSRQADRFLPVLRVSAAQGADACFAAGADLRGAVWASANEEKSAAVKDGRQFPNCAAARPPRRKAGKKPDMAACVHAPQAQASWAGLFPTRAKPAGFPKGKWCASGGASDEISGRYAFSRL